MTESYAISVKREAGALHERDLGSALSNPHELINRDAPEDLLRARRRPRHFDRLNRCRVAEADLLLQRRGAIAAAGRTGRVDVARAARRCDANLHPRADAKAIRSRALQSDRN